MSRRLPDMRYYVILPGTVVERLERVALRQGTDPQDMAGRLLSQAIDRLEPGPSLLPGPSFQGPFPAEGAGWCRSGIPEDWKAPEPQRRKRR